MQTVFVSAILSIALSFVVMAAMIMLSCITLPQWALKCVALLSFLASMCQGLLCLMYQSKLTQDPFGGSFFIGALTVIVAMIASVATGIFILIVPPPGSVSTVSLASPPQSSLPITTEGTTNAVPPVSHKRNFPAPPRKTALPETAPPEQSSEKADDGAFAPGTETVTETVLPDGSKKVTTTAVHSDGSKSVTESIVHTHTATL